MRYMLCGTLFLITSNAVASQQLYSTPIKHSSQQDPCWCSIATVEMFATWDWGRTAFTQNEIAEHTGVEKFSNGNCPTGGLNVNELTDALNETSYSKKYTRSPYFSGNSMLVDMMSSIKDGNPVALLGYTRYKNGDKFANKHYYTVNKVATNRINNTEALQGFYLLDPVYKAKRLNRVKSISPYKFLSTNYILNTIASRSKWKRYNIVSIDAD